ncbi:PTS system mannose/fructose/N-acetylgalactosamine-transporter subunit IIB [Seleniivibrio woodruffii]|uniref:PTS system mannose-specific IIB component n=1 Tax=Seleniivibrio woodruffii TaxID=1078050 RepID=A0A4R1K8Z9_9BACT|nr:PTS sugar transporter subunit IIB [Seleniivibrio woodruffii]TCK60846.1 PTS system mannose-specific IIB component [Seleniivibrio woodruffii]TVZ36476.1 PTS system mannose-specific IIB component [Seleniivibrio woodruffii]
MKKIIFRVDDRLIHGQVIEGWIKHFKINHVILVNDKVSRNPLQKMIYSSTLPPGTEISIMSLAEFLNSFKSERYKKDYVLVLLESVDDLYTIRSLISDETYVNIGCVACREHKIEVSNTVFLNPDEIRKICEIRQDYEVFIHKVSWEPSVEIKNFNDVLEGNL